MPPRYPAALIPELRSLWLGSISEIADIHLQWASWRNPENKNPHWSYVEIVESYFEQIGLREGYGYAVENRIVSAGEALAAKAFHELLSAYQPPNGDQFDHRAILEDPNWLAVSNAAEKAFEALLRLSFNSPTYLGAFDEA